ncbi:hypothetical protein JCM5296_005387 [Sporobolomyces johnsonii]
MSTNHNSEEQQFTIQPHPAKDNYAPFPGSDAEATPGLGSAPNLAHLHQAQQDPTGGRGSNPHIISQETAEGLEQPKSREELQALSAKLNE